LSIILIVAALLVYSNTLTSSFQFDDTFFIVNNLSIRELGNLMPIWKGVLSQPSRFVAFYTFALNYHFHKLNVAGYHAVNIFIHICSGFLFWWFMRLVINTPKLKDEPIARYKDIVSFLAALIFVVHPVQTQAVTYISQRFSSLATLFYIMSLCFYIRGRLERTVSKVMCLNLFGSGVSAILAMFTKEIAVTLPLAIILTEYFLFSRKRGFFEDFKEENGKQIVFGLVILGALLIIPKLFQFNFAGLMFGEKMSQSHDGDVITFGSYLISQFRVFAVFLRLMVMPFGQNLDHDFMLSKSILEWPAVISLLIFIGSFILGLYLRKKDLLASYGIFLFMLSFSANFVPRSNLIFEHKLYLLSVGFIMCGIAILFKAIKPFKKFVISVCIVALVFSCLTYLRNSIWKDEISLWEDVVKKSPNKLRPLINLAKAYLNQENFEPAIIYLNKALKMDPDSYKAYNNRGVFHRLKGRYDLAMEDYNKAIAINPFFSLTYGNRGVLLQKIGRDDLALKDFNTSLALNPNNAEVYNNLGLLYKNIKQKGLMVENYNKSIEMDPSNSRVYNNRANYRAKEKRFDLALADYNMAIAIDPNSAESYNGRGATYYQLADPDLAVKDYSKAIAMRKNFYQAYNNRAMAYHAKGLYELALKDFNKTLSLNPKYLQAYYSRGELYVKIKQYDRAINDYSKVLALEPDTVNAYHNRAAVYWETKQYELALKDIDRAIDLDEKLASAYFIKSLICSSLGQKEEALKSAQQAKNLGLLISDKYFIGLDQLSDDKEEKVNE
ncbi:MAG: tetratricopeptide repeat protein, partial [Candidatus Omnitrophica bacterium]|nr:tetratricopeptide repeat protein [Candidatus Omnitrophota bacterium]